MKGADLVSYGHKWSFGLCRANYARAGTNGPYLRSSTHGGLLRKAGDTILLPGRSVGYLFVSAGILNNSLYMKEPIPGLTATRAASVVMGLGSALSLR